MVKAIVGACWGDEGKGKITDLLAEDADIVIRFQGAAMPAIPSSMIMVNLRYTRCRAAYLIPTPSISLARAWLLMFPIL